MRQAPQWQRGTRLWVALLLCVLLAGQWAGFFSISAHAEEYVDDVRYSAPRLPSDVVEYDATHPENLMEEQLYAKTAILIEAKTGRVIFEKNADERMYPASMTKMLTILIGIKMGELSQTGGELVSESASSDDGWDDGQPTAEDTAFEELMRQAVTHFGHDGANLFEQTATMSASALILEQGSIKIPLEAGETIKFEDLLYATMVRSGNDGANLIAEFLCGTTENFVAIMNMAAETLGLTDTYFMSPTGLHHNDHYSTARDMAKLAQFAMKNERFRKMAKTYVYKLSASNLRKNGQTLVSSADAMLNRGDGTNEFYYAPAVGIKTGFHRHAGYCFTGGAVKDGIQLISVVMYTSENGRWIDTKKLMEYGYSQFVSMTPQEVFAENPLVIETAGFAMDDTDLGRLQLNLVPIKSGQDNDAVYIVGTVAEVAAIARNLKQNVLIEYTRTSFAAPVEEGEEFGTLTYQPTDGSDAVSYRLVASRSIAKRINAPRSIEEIEAEVRADPNPFPPLSVELVLILLAPFVVIFIIIRLLMRLFRRTGRHKKGRVPKPENRYFR